jgi:hypothetical protein
VREAFFAMENCSNIIKGLVVFLCYCLAVTP